MRADLHVLAGVLLGFLFALNVLYDKAFVLDRVSPVVAASVTGLLSPLIFIPVSVIFRASFPGFEAAGALFGAALLFAPGMYLYLLGLRKGDPANVSVVSRSEPFLVMVLAAAFLGEVLSTVSYLGAGLVLAGVGLVSFHRKKGSIVAADGAGLVVLSAAVFAVRGVLLRFIFESTEVTAWTGYLWSRIGILSGFVVLLLLADPKLSEVWNGLRNPLESGYFSLGLRAVIIEGVGVVYTVGIARGPVSVLTTLGAIQPVIVTVVAGVLASKTGVISAEEVSSTPLWIKLSASALVLAGVYLLF